MIKRTEMLNGDVNIDRMIVRLMVFGCLIMSIGCARDSVRVTGEVVRIRGNQMPSPDLPDPVYPGFKTNIYFYQPVSLNMATPVNPGGMYSRINGILSGTAASNAQGRFSIRLKPGRYSVLIGNDSLYYSNIRDGAGVLNPVDIPSSRKFHIRLRADWDATY